MRTVTEQRHHRGGVGFDVVGLAPVAVRERQAAGGEGGAEARGVVVPGDEHAARDAVGEHDAGAAEERVVQAAGARGRRRRGARARAGRHEQEVPGGEVVREQLEVAEPVEVRNRRRGDEVEDRGGGAERQGCAAVQRVARRHARSPEEGFVADLPLAIDATLLQRRLELLDHRAVADEVEDGLVEARQIGEHRLRDAAAARRSTTARRR